MGLYMNSRDTIRLYRTASVPHGRCGIVHRQVNEDLRGSGFGMKYV